MELPRTDILRTENYRVKSKEELIDILKEYVKYCTKKKLTIGTTLSVLRYYQHMCENTFSYFNRRKKKTYTKSEIKKRVEFIGKSLFWKKTHGDLKEVIFNQSSYKSKSLDLDNIKRNLYVDKSKLRTLLIEEDTSWNQIQ